jgi:ElaA protein
VSGLSFELARLAELEAAEVHDLLMLRAEVFVVEQRCAFLDPDELDHCSWHLLGREPGGLLVAYLRIVDPGRKYEEPAIGRVVTKPSRRARGLGRLLMREGIVRAQQVWPGRAIRIAAQHRLEAFYQEQGFVTAGSVFIEDDIAHVEMLLAAPANARTT